MCKENRLEAGPERNFIPRVWRIAAGSLLRWRRALKTVVSILLSPVRILRNLFIRDWEQRITVFTVMQNHNNHTRAYAKLLALAL